MGGERIPPASLEAYVIVYGIVAIAVLTPFIAIAALIVAIFNIQ
jgi:hypothetical protein